MRSWNTVGAAPDQYLKMSDLRGDAAREQIACKRLPHLRHRPMTYSYSPRIIQLRAKSWDEKMVKPMLSTPRCGDRENQRSDMEVVNATFRNAFSSYNLHQLFSDHINLLREREVNTVLSYDNFISQESTELDSEGGERGARLRSLY